MNWQDKYTEQPHQIGDKVQLITDYNGYTNAKQGYIATITSEPHWSDPNILVGITKKGKCGICPTDKRWKRI